MCACVCTCVSMYMHIYVYGCMCVCASVYVCVCIYLCACACVHVRVCVCAPLPSCGISQAQEINSRMEEAGRATGLGDESQVVPHGADGRAGGGVETCLAGQKHLAVLGDFPLQRLLEIGTCRGRESMLRSHEL